MQTGLTHLSIPAPGTLPSDVRRGVAVLKPSLEPSDAIAARGSQPVAPERQRLAA